MPVSILGANVKWVKKLKNHQRDRKNYFQRNAPTPIDIPQKIQIFQLPTTFFFFQYNMLVLLLILCFQKWHHVKQILSGEALKIISFGRSFESSLFFKLCTLILVYWCIFSQPSHLRAISLQDDAITKDFLKIAS